MRPQASRTNGYTARMILSLILSALALSVSPGALPAQGPPAFCAQLRSLTKEPGVAAAHWGISVTTLEGKPLCQINDAQLFRPASNAKLFTAAAAIALLGAGATSHTVLDIQPAVDRGQTDLHGDVVLRGFGDPFLSGEPVPYVAPRLRTATGTAVPTPLEDFAARLAATGITHIFGNVIGDDSAWPYEPYPGDWTIDDTVWDYGAPVSALSVDDNVLTLTVAPGLAPGSAARVSLVPDVGYYQVENQATTSAGEIPSAIVTERLPGSRVVRVRGTVSLGAPLKESLAVADPAEYAALRLKLLLEARGITIDGRARARHRPAAAQESFARQVAQPILKMNPVLGHGEPVCPSDACQVIASHSSPPLKDDVLFTLKTSQNLHAELLLHQLGSLGGLDRSTAQGCRVVRQFALDAGIPKDDFMLFDGSGLSGHDLVTPRALTRLLVFASKQEWFADFKAALPIGGVDGTLAGRFPGALKGRVFAKTGTLGESRALSGYVTADDGRTLVFSIMVDNHPPSTTADRTVMDRMVETIAAPSLR